jgi:hypothetical protein
VKCVWVPTTMSLHGSYLGSPLPKAQSEQCLSVVRNPQARLTGGPGLYPGLSGEEGEADR